MRRAQRVDRERPVREPRLRGRFDPERNVRAAAFVASIAALVLAGARAAAAPAGAGSPEPRVLLPERPPRTASIEVDLRHDPDAACWRVRLRASGIDPAAGSVHLVLEDWGEWSEIDAYYLRELRARPPVRSDDAAPGDLALEPPERWDGALELEYVIPLARDGTRARAAHRLLPCQDATHARGFSINTLFDVAQGGSRLEAVRTVRLSAPPDVAIATGWGGVSKGTQEVSFRHAIDNAPILFGAPSGRAGAHEREDLYEVVQFGPAADRTADVLRVARALAPLYAKNAARPFDEPVRVLLTPLHAGGTQTDHGAIVGLDAGETSPTLSVEDVRLLAHELFHAWLGGHLDGPGDESLVWLFEGFTDYLAHWHATAAALAGRDWFAERVVSIDEELRRSSAFGRVAFGEPGTRWRDGNGPNETLAYRGGAVLAFLADVELRRRGEPGLMQLLADLLRDGDRELAAADVRAWMRAHGLAEFWERCVDRPGLPEVGPALREIGFEADESAANLTYLGIRADVDRLPAAIEALDPEGPAARAGLAVGDLVVACAPERMRRPRVGEDVTTSYRFGLDLVATGAKPARVEIVRAGERRTIDVEPRIVTGGTRTAYRARGAALDPFFRFEARREAR